jgi:myo-inositol-1(or 4)-monophosphatase
VNLQRALLATGFPYQRDEVVTRNVEYLRRFLHAKCHGVRRGGSAALDLCHVAAGRLDGFWEMKLRPWDVAAGTLIAREAGALVTDFDGNSGLLSGESILAAVPGLHQEMLTMLSEEPNGQV